MNQLKAIALTLLATSSACLAGEALFSSGPQRVSLLELYTSEGCSSCPPAEALFAGFRNDPRLWKEIVPVAFHVTYFDRLGWKDRFGSEQFTARQKAYGQLWSAENIYTPCLVENGVEWRSRSSTKAPANAAGTLRVQCSEDGHASVIFKPASDLPVAHFEVNVAVLGGGLSTDVRRGENAGKKLDHEFVAFELKHAPLASQPDGTFTGVIDFTKPQARAPRTALAVWVTEDKSLIPLQTAGGWLD